MFRIGALAGQIRNDRRKKNHCANFNMSQYMNWRHLNARLIYDTMNPDMRTSATRGVYLVYIFLMLFGALNALKSFEGLMVGGSAAAIRGAGSLGGHVKCSGSDWAERMYGQKRIEREREILCGERGPVLQGS